MKSQNALTTHKVISPAMINGFLLIPIYIYIHIQLYFTIMGLTIFI